MSVIVFKSDLIRSVFNKVHKDQIEIFNYNVNDHNHIYINKYYLYIDTLLRALHYTATIVNNIKATYKHNVKRLYIINDNINVSEDPYYTLITTSNPVSIETTYNGQLKKIGDALSKILAIANDYEAVPYKRLEAWLMKEANGNMLIYSQGTYKRSTDNMHKDNVKDEYGHTYKDRLIYRYNIDISEALGVLQMHVSKDEQVILMNTYINVLCNGGISNVSIKLLKHTYKTMHINYVRYALTSSAKVLIISNSLTPTMNETIVYAKLNPDLSLTRAKHIPSKKTMTAPVKQLSLAPRKSYNVKSIRVKPLKISMLMKYIDKLYNGCTLYINTYTVNLFEYVTNLYRKHSFITPQTEIYEDTDFTLCFSEVFEVSIILAIEQFNKAYNTKITY